MHCDAAETPAPLQRRIQRWFVPALLLLAGVWFARFAYLRITVRPSPRPAYWAEKIAELDPPTLQPLAADDVVSFMQDRPFEAVLNVATTQPDWYLFDMSELLTRKWNEASPEVVFITNVFESPQFTDRRRALIERSARHWSLPVHMTPFGFFAYHQHVRAWAKWLVAHSRWSREHAGDDAAAIEDWLTVLRISREARRPGRFVDQMTGVICAVLVSHEMIYAARELSPMSEPQAFWRRIDAAAGPRLIGRPLFEAERLFYHSLLEHLFVSDGGDWLDVSAAAGLNSGGGAAWRGWNLLSPLFRDLATARGRVDRAFEYLSRGANLVECWKAYREAESAPSPSAADGFITLYSPFVARMPLECLRAYQLTEAATAMVAIEQYHRRHGHYPDSLECLVPEFAPRVPLDFADGQPLRYRREEQYYVLYTIAEDGVDNGGVIERRWTGWASRPEWERDADFIFTDMFRPRTKE